VEYILIIVLHRIHPLSLSLYIYIYKWSSTTPTYPLMPPLTMHLFGLKIRMVPTLQKVDTIGSSPTQILPLLISLMVLGRGFGN
jgi:hypothetical protein